MSPLDYAEDCLIEVSRLQRQAFALPVKKRKKQVRKRPVRNRLRIVWMLPELGQPALRAQDIASALSLSLRETYRLMAELRPITVQHNGAGGGYWRKP